jgi:hypothetical protein
VQVKFEFGYGPLIMTKLSLLKLQKVWNLQFPLNLEKIKHGFKTLAACGGIRGFDDTSSSPKGFWGKNA